MNGLPVALMLIAASVAEDGGMKSELAVSTVVDAQGIDLDEESPTGGASDLLLSQRPVRSSADFTAGTRFSLRLEWPKNDAGLSAEAFVALGVGYTLDGDLEIPAESPFLRVRWQPGSWRDAEGLFLTVYPVDSQQLHLGWEYPATWGGTVYAGRLERAPAAELRLARERWYGFAAARTDTTERQNARWWMGLTGAGVEPRPGLQFEMEGAAVGGPVGTQWSDSNGLVAVSGRILYQRGEPIGPSVDFGRYGTAPDYFHVYLQPERYPGGVSASASLESTFVVRPATGSGAGALALQLRARSGFLRAHLLGLYRSATYRSSGEERRDYSEWHHSGQPPNERGGVLVRGGVDYHFARPRLTPGLVLSAELPRFFKSAIFVGSSEFPDSPVWAYSVLVEEGGELGFVRSDTRRAIFSAKATLRWDWAEWLSVVGELGWVRDGNRAAWGLSDEMVTWDGAFVVQARM